MKLYRKNGEMSTPMFYLTGALLAIDCGAIMGEIIVLLCFAVWGEPVPMLSRVFGWILFAVNAAVLLEKLKKENRKIRLGMIPKELICEVMEGKR